jgi:hypothetical protein
MNSPVRWRISESDCHLPAWDRWYESGIDEPDPVFVFGIVVIDFKVFSMGPHVHEEDGAIQIGTRMFLGDHRFLDGVHAAYGGTVGMVAAINIPGAHALDPGDFFGFL